MSLQLQIETTNVCQAKCVFCPYPTMQRPKGTMRMALYQRIIDDANTVPAIDKVTLTGLGEPLLDKHIIARIRYARKVLPHGVVVDMYTNGSRLTRPVVDDLVDAGLGILYVSLNATSREKRREVMDLDDYDQVVENIHYAIDAGAGKMTVIAKGIVSKDLMEIGDPDVFMDNWGGAFDKGGRGFLHLEGNWAGATGLKMRTKPTTACSRALGQIMVLCDGRVSLCCFDSEGGVILGDLNTQSLRDVYNGPKAVGIREAHNQGLRQEIPICAGCTSI